MNFVLCRSQNAQIMHFIYQTKRGVWKSRGGFQNPWVGFDFLNRFLEKITPRNSHMNFTFLENPGVFFKIHPWVLRDTLFKTGDEIRGWDPYIALFCWKKFVRKKCTFSWDPCIWFARAHEQKPVEETCMDIFSSTISWRIGYLSKIKHYIFAKNCILQRVLKSERIWSNFCTNLISFVLRFKKCVS